MAPGNTEGTATAVGAHGVGRAQVQGVQGVRDNCGRRMAASACAFAGHVHVPVIQLGRAVVVAKVLGEILAVERTVAPRCGGMERSQGVATVEHGAEDAPREAHGHPPL